MTKMNPEIKARWVAALRSGEYKQGSGELRSGSDRFCCLGVLCDIKGGQWIPHEYEGGPYSFNEPSGFDYPPLSLMEWAGIDWFETHVQIGAAYLPLADHNDEGRSFAEIADAIEEQL